MNNIPEKLVNLPGHVVIQEELDDLLHTLSISLYGSAQLAVEERGAFHLALSGGNTPKVLFNHLMIDPRYRDLPWQQTHIWQVDERCVSHDDERSNFKMIKDWVVNQVPITDNQVHPMPAIEENGDRCYEKELRQLLPDNQLDFILLGMGGDGHTASLFPQTKALYEVERWIVFNDGDTVAEPRPRMTMTYPLINTAHQAAIFITGQSKREMLSTISEAFKQAKSNRPDHTDLPIAGVDNNHLTWYLDAKAAGV